MVSCLSPGHTGVHFCSDGSTGIGTVVVVVSVLVDGGAVVSAGWPVACIGKGIVVVVDGRTIITVTNTAMTSSRATTVTVKKATTSFRERGGGNL